MKNALDWLVGGVEFVQLPVMLINTSPRSYRAYDALREVVTTMSGNIIDEACLDLPLLGSGLDAAGIVHDEGLRTVLERHLQAFCQAINGSGAP